MSTDPWTDATYKLAWRLRQAAGQTGGHRRDLARRLRCSTAQYNRALRCAREMAWVTLQGKGKATRVVDALPPGTTAAEPPPQQAAAPDASGENGGAA